MNNRMRKSQSGFSLVELLVVVTLLMIVTGVVLGYIQTAQRRYDNERTKIDMTQQTRDFMDQISRDLHMVGYPTLKMYQNAPANTSASVAAGLVQITPTQLWFEGDVDNDGDVDVVQYQLVQDFPPAPGNPVSCPCRLQRGQFPKQPNVAPLAQGAPVFFVDAQGIINSNNTWVIGGFTSGNIPNDNFFAAYKNQPIFQAFQADGTPVALPVTLNDIDPATNRPWTTEIRTIRVNMNVLGANPDYQTRQQPVITMATTAKILN